MNDFGSENNNDDNNKVCLNPLAVAIFALRSSPLYRSVLFQKLEPQPLALATPARRLALQLLALPGVRRPSA